MHGVQPCNGEEKLIARSLFFSLFDASSTDKKEGAMYWFST